MTRYAHIHSKDGALEEVEVLEWKDNNNIRVLTQDGVTCTAIYNLFAGCVYADDVYGIIEENKKEV